MALLGFPRFPIFRRATDRTLLAIGLAVIAGLGLLALLIIGLGRHPQAEPASALVITDSRICAASAVYTLATADDWSQRAAIAQSTLNGYRRTAPSCGDLVARIVEHEFSPAQWQAALDAVDAVQSGDYPLPLACVRADTVVPPSTLDSGSPLFRSAARTQCVIGDLAFVQVAR